MSENSAVVDDVKAQSLIKENETELKHKTRKEKMAERKLEYCDPVRENQRKLLKDVFINLDDELFQTIVYSILEDSENPLLDIIPLYQCLPEQKSTSSSSMTARLVHFLHKWVHKVGVEDIQEKYLTSEVKSTAFAAFSQFHCQFLNILEDVYLFNADGDLEMFREQIKKLNDKGLYREAMDLACYAGIFNKYDIHDFIIPLFLQDKSAIAIDVLKSTPDCQHLKIKLLKYFDELLSIGDVGCEKKLLPYKDRKIMLLPFERFQGKTLIKLIVRLIDELELGDETSYAPSFYQTRVEGKIRYQVFCRYNNDKLMGDTAYFDLMKHTIDTSDEKVLIYLIEYLTKSGHFEDAMRWVIVYNFPVDALPSALQRAIRDNPRMLEEARREVERYKKTHVDSPVFLENNHPVIMASTWEDLEVLMGEIEETEYIGLDSEFKPSSGIKPGVALLQCSLLNNTYLVDILTLESTLTLEQWRKFLTTLFCGKASKFGFDFINDMQCIFNNHPFNLLLDIVEHCNVICLKRLVENIIQVDETFVDFSKISKSHDGSMTDHEIGNLDIIHFGLGDLSILFCGVTLNKEEQCGNWNLRPLRTEQKLYAAMDAYIVTQIFIKIKALAEERGLVLENFYAESIVNSLKKAKVKKDKTTKLDHMEWSECVEALNSKVIGDITHFRKPKDLKCIVDMMLRGLGKNLRRIGVDVIMCDSKPQVTYEAARRPERIIFTAGRSYDALRGTFPTRVVCIQNVACNPLAQLKKVVEKYNLVFDKKDVFSRCMECNCDYFVRAPSIVLRALHFCHVICTQPYYDEPFDFNAWFDRLQEASEANTNPIPFRIDRSPESDEWISVTVEDGVIDITRNIVLHRSKDDGIPCAIVKIPEQVFHFENRFFYICCQCGKVYWDGKHKDNYTEAVEALSNNFSELKTPSAEE